MGDIDRVEDHKFKAGQSGKGNSHVAPQTARRGMSVFARIVEECMSENDNGDDSRFKPGQSGNPAGKPKGAVNGRSRALAALDRITGKEENVRILADALEEQLRKKPVWFFVNIIMPLLPRESRGVLEAGDRVVEWKSLVTTAGASAVARGGDENAE